MDRPFFQSPWGTTLVGFVYKFAPAGGARSYALGYVIAYLVLFCLMIWYLKDIFSRKTLVLSLASVLFLGVLTLISLKVSMSSRLMLAAPFLLFSLAASFVVLGKGYSIRILDKIKTILSTKKTL